MIVLAGASASGKTEAAKMLAAKYGITKVITTTTRPMRVGEVHARDYFFVSKEESEYIKRYGSEQFEDLLEEKDVDVIEIKRKSIL
jgi:guanylate kinase